MRITTGLATVGTLLLGVGLFFWSSPGKAAREPSSEVSLKSLRALPYASLGDKGARPEDGVVRYDPSRTSDGLNLYTNEVDEVYLMDMQGNRLHRWKISGGRHCAYAELTPEGKLLAVCWDQKLVKLGPDSEVLMQADLPVHHEVVQKPDGSLLVPITDDVREYNGHRVRFDSIVHLSAEGRVLGKWSLFDHRQELRRFHPASLLDQQDGSQVRPELSQFNSTQEKTLYDYHHLNSIQLLPDTELGRRDPRFRAGNWLISMRNVSLIAIVDQEKLQPVWGWGPGSLDFPHMPRMQLSGNILVFDNGFHAGFSRILEVEPQTGRFVWSYLADPLTDFYTRERGSNQRLPNGNTLICESDRGRVFEVTPGGEIVWEFINPDTEEGGRKRIYRMLRYFGDIPGNLGSGE